MRRRATSLFLRRNRLAQAGEPDQKPGVTTTWRSIALWKKPLPGARLIGTGLPLAAFLTARRTDFHLAWRTAMYSATWSRFRRVLSLKLTRVDEWAGTMKCKFVHAREL